MRNLSLDKKQKLYGMFFILLFAGLTVSPASGIKRIFLPQDSFEIETSASQYYSEIDDNGLRHFSYITSPDSWVRAEDEGSRNDTTYKYGTYDPNTGEESTEVIATNVIPYHYNFVIDSDGNTHTVYVDVNKVLNFITRDATTGVWSAPEALTDPIARGGVMNVSYPTVGEIPYDPFIALNENDEVRIIYGVNFLDNETAIFDEDFSRKNTYTIHYKAWDAGQWKTYDLLNNSVRGDTLSYLRLQPSYPSMAFYDGKVYFTWANKFSLQTENRLQFMYLDTELPDGVDTRARLYDRVDKLGTQTYFRRSNIIVRDTEILLIYSGEVQGGARISYIQDIADVENQNDARGSFTYYNLDPNRDFRPVDYLSTAVHEDIIYVSWSMFDRYGGEKFYEYDVYTGSVNFDGISSIDNWDFARITLSDNIDHRFPIVNIFDGIAEVSYIQATNSSAVLEFMQEQPQTEPLAPATGGFVVGLVLVIGIAFLIRFLLYKVPAKEKEKELLPHLINLKDSIEKD
ncbi:MAG: hypothetical protein INQ03_04410 [Candidatus Heimdallarchaeota archaeon]|nr:hypothetical protein [Candidatus Heimdallarchaeota archaeon]